MRPRMSGANQSYIDPDEFKLPDQLTLVRTSEPYQLRTDGTFIHGFDIK